MVDFQAGPFPVATLRVVCSTGTYVRALADDLARALSGRAHLEALRRLRVGSFKVEEAMLMSGLSDWRRHLLEEASAVAALPQLVVKPDEVASVTSGRSLTSEIQGEFAVLDASGALLAVYRGEQGIARPEVVLA
jgi:tRNA pseudouridine55 synthase